MAFLTLTRTPLVPGIQSVQDGRPRFAWNGLVSLVVVSAGLFTVPNLTQAEPDAHRETQDCTERSRETTVEVQLQNWPQVDTLARDSIRKCSGVYDKREMAKAYSAIALANNEMGRFTEGLAQANTGISMDYQETSNHLEKVRALLALKKIAEAKEAFRIADEIIHLAIKRNDDELRTPRSEEERQMRTTDRTLNHIQLGILDRYRATLGN